MNNRSLMVPWQTSRFALQLKEVIDKSCRPINTVQLHVNRCGTCSFVKGRFHFHTLPTQACITMVCRRGSAAFLEFV